MSTTGVPTAAARWTGAVLLLITSGRQRQQARQVGHVEVAGQRIGRGVHGGRDPFDQRAIGLRSGEDDAAALLADEHPRQRGERFRGPAPRGGRGPGMDHHPGLAVLKTALLEQPLDLDEHLLRHVQREPLVVGVAAHGGHKVQLPPHLVADLPGRFGFRHRVREELADVLLRVGQPPRDGPQVAEHGRRQRVLAPAGEDHGGVELPMAELLDQLRLGIRRTPPAAARQPQGFVAEDGVDFGG